MQKALAPALAPDDLPARHRLATQHVEMGNTAEAIRHYQAILEHHPNAPPEHKQPDKMAFTLD